MPPVYFFVYSSFRLYAGWLDLNISYVSLECVSTEGHSLT
jgi:hypothetical protein